MTLQATKQQMLDRIDALKLSLDYLASEVRFNGPHKTSQEYVDMLEAFDALADIDGIGAEIDRIREGWADFAPTPAELRAGRYADALIDERIGK